MPGKFQELILYICQRSEGDSNFGITKLNKLLWFSDMAVFLRTGHTITSRQYKKLQYGPVPVDYEETIRDMCNQGCLAIRVEDHYGYPQKRLLALVQPNLGVFTADEIALVDDTIRRYWHLNGSDISNLSHGFLGWQLAQMGETIPFEVGFVERPCLAPDEMAYATTLTSIPEYVECHGN